MNLLWLTIPISLLLAAFFVIAFIVAVRRDQFEDLVTPAHRMLLDDEGAGPTPDDSRKDDDDVTNRRER